LKFPEEFFRTGVDPQDVPALFPLLRARGALGAFTALFRGTDEDILIRLLVLREIGRRGEQPSWSPQELHVHFAYLDETKLQTVLHRLRDTGLLVWNPESSNYKISPHGRMALSALSVLLKFSEEEDGEIGYITSQLAAGQALGKVSDEDLQHLLSRLIELEEEFSRAVLSGSELRIRNAEKKLTSVLNWVEKGTEIMKVIAADHDLDLATHRVARKIGQVQSRMLRMSSVFQRTLNQLERQKVHLGQSGLSTSDIHRWLRMLERDGICALFGDAMTFPARIACLLNDIALDIAEFELVDRVRAEAEDTSLPQPCQAPPAEDMPIAEEDLTLLTCLLRELSNIEAEVPVETTIPAENFATTSYRLSLVALLGDPESSALEGTVADLARLPLVMDLTGEAVEVGYCEVETMSAGTLKRKREINGGEDGERGSGTDRETARSTVSAAGGQTGPEGINR
jgi:hypothetical protein